MTTISKALAKGTIASVTAGVMALAPVAAQARDRDDRVDAGEIIAGALIIGGIAAIASAASNDRDDYREGYGYRDGDRNRNNRGNYDRGYGDNPRRAVEQCVRAAERDAGRHSWGDRAKVTDIRGIDRTRGGFRVEGRIAVNQMGRDWNRGDRRYGRGWDNDYRGWNDNYRGWDSGRFSCDIRQGRVVDLDYSGIRGLR